jgi:hypothetical protein
MVSLAAWVMVVADASSIAAAVAFNCMLAPLVVGIFFWLILCGRFVNMRKDYWKWEECTKN